jgi:hypothetical protein
MWQRTGELGSITPNGHTTKSTREI